MSDLIQNGEVRLFGTIVKDEFIWPDDTGFFSSRMVADALAQFQGDVTLVVNSDGGMPSEGEAIRAALEAHRGKVTVKVTGAAHSAASLMIMAADRIEMSAGSLMLIHDPSVAAHGTPAALSAAADALDVMAGAYAGVYAARAGITPDEARAIMRAETMLTADAAVEAGFADIVTASPDPAAGDPAMSRVSALVAIGAAMTRAHEAQMKFEAAKSGLETGESQNPGQAAISASNGVSNMPNDNNQAPATSSASAATMGATAASATALSDATAPAAMNAPAPAAPTEAQMNGAVSAERARVKAIRAAAAPFMAHVGQDEVDRMVDEGTSLEDANAIIMRAAAAAQPRTRRVEVIRDERETMSAGMIDGLAAQLTGNDPADERAHPYMEKSIVQMAAELTGQKTPRSFGAKNDVLMMAAHGVSDFPLILGEAFNRVIESAYDMVDPTFAAFSREMTFNDFRAHDIVRPDNFPTLQKIGENGEIKFGTFGEGKESLVLASYATGIAVSRQMMINDHMGAIAEVLNNAAGIVPEFEEETFWSMVLSNPVLSDATALFHANHGNLAATGAINTANVAAGRLAMRSQKQADGRAVPANAPALLICGPAKETEAEQFLAPLYAADAANVNPLAKTLRLVVSEEITDATWFLSVDKSKKTHAFKHGYLDGYRAPRIRVEDPFGQQGTQLTIEHDFATGAVGYMGVYRRG